jgi:hypothetical protein
VFDGASRDLFEVNIPIATPVQVGIIEHEAGSERRTITSTGADKLMKEMEQWQDFNEPFPVEYVPKIA